MNRKILMKLILLLALFSFYPNMTSAFDSDIYGDIKVTAFQRMFTRWDYDSIGEDTLGQGMWGPDSLGGTINTQEWLPTGHLGFIIKTDQFAGCIEFGVGKNVYDSKLSGSTTTRVLYNKYNNFFKVNKWFAEWYINDNFTFTTGQDYTPTNFLNNNKALAPDIGYGNFGVFYTGPRPMFQMKLSLLDNMMELKGALVKVDTCNIPVQDQDAGTVTNEITFPKIEGSFQFGMDNDDNLFGVRTKVAGGFQKFSTFKQPQDQAMDTTKKSDWTLPINSYVVGGDFAIRIWRITLTASAFLGQNLAPYGMVAGEPGAWWHEYDHQYMRVLYPIHAIDTTVKRGYTLYNSSQFEYSVVLTIKPVTFLHFEAGFGDITGEHELEEQLSTSGDLSGINKKWDDASNYGWYLQAMGTILENFSITGEFGENRFGKYKGFGRFKYGALRFGLQF